MTEALTLSDFASQLSASSAPEGQAEQAPEAEGQELPEVEETTADAVQPEGEQSPEDTTAEEAAPEDGQAETAPDEEMVVKWKTAAGETYEEPLKELKDGYMRREHFTQETQKLAQEKERSSQVLQQALEQTQAIGPELARLQTVQAQIAQYQNLNWDAIRAADPQQYNTLASEFLILREQGKELFQTAQLKVERIKQMRQQEAVEAEVASGDHLRKVIKDFGEKHLNAMNSHMLSKGLKQEDLPEVVKRLGKQYAPAVMEVIHEAAQWRALQATKPDIANRAKAIPPKPAAKAQQAKPTSQQEQLAKVAASGKPMSSTNFAELMAQTRRK